MFHFNKAKNEGRIVLLRCEGFECDLCSDIELSPMLTQLFRKVLFSSPALLDNPHPLLKTLSNSSPEGCFHPDAHYVFGLFPFS